MVTGSLVGRDRERHRITELLEAGQRGRSAALVIEGEPGVGKTALLDDAVDQTAGMTVLRARGGGIARCQRPIRGRRGVAGPACDGC